MRVPRVYVATPLPAEGEISLPPETAHYLGTVLRMTPGRELRLFDGSGAEFAAELSAVGKKSASAHIQARHPCATESPLHTHLILGISRGERMEYALQKAVELGVSRISPVTTERGEVRLSGERGDKKLNHWQAILISAAEQSGRARLPQLDPLQALPACLDQPWPGLRLVLAPGGSTRLSQLPAPAAVSLVIGPEGGLSEAELSLCEAAGCTRIGLGPRILRTETAPLAALTAVQLLWGDLADNPV